MSESEENVTKPEKSSTAPEKANVTSQEKISTAQEKKPDTPEDENAENERKEMLQKDDQKSKTQEGDKKNNGQMYKEETYHKPKCNMRIEELAKPNKNQVRTVYIGYKHVLPKRNIQVVNEYLQEEYAKSPEEAEQIFKKQRRKEKESECRNVCEKEAKKKQTEKINEKKRQKMLDILTDILKKYMLKAHSNPKQIIMTNRLRNLSNMVLKKLCEIRNINVPHRESTSIRATLMYAVSDYFAFCINTIYYEMQLRKIKDYEELKPLPEKKRVRKSYENAAVKPKRTS